MFEKVDCADRVWLKELSHSLGGSKRWKHRRIDTRPTAWVEANPNALPGLVICFIFERAWKRLRIDYHHAVGFTLIRRRRRHLGCLPSKCDTLIHGPRVGGREDGGKDWQEMVGVWQTTKENGRENREQHQIVLGSAYKTCHGMVCGVVG